MNRIQKVSSLIVTTLTVLIVTLPLASLLLWLFIDTPSMPKSIINGLYVHASGEMIALGHVTWTPLTKMIGLLSDWVGYLPLFISLFILKSVFKNYMNGSIFSAANATSFRHLSQLFLIHASIAKPLQDMLLTLATTLSNPPGRRYLEISFGTPNLESVFCGIMMLVISWVMLEASKLHDEQTLTI